MHLESIVLPALRPAFDIVNESYGQLPGVWDVWNQRIGQAQALIRGVGRLQLMGHPSYTLVGTGFVCGPNLILTNRHVAQIFVEGIGSGMHLTYSGGVTGAMEMYAEVGSSASLIVNMVAPLSVSTTWDVALFEVDALPAGVNSLPLASAVSPVLENADAAVVGYPSYDPFESFVDQTNIFRGLFDRKRFQPGKLIGRQNVLSFGNDVSALAHDCSTLGGNSGSALICADTSPTLGLIEGPPTSDIKHVARSINNRSLFLCGRPRAHAH